MSHHTQCPHCGTNNPVDRKLCKHCHKPLHGNGQPPSALDDDIPAIVDSDNIDYDVNGDDEYDGTIYGDHNEDED